ncbi:MAG: MFS transporter [Acidimicrobiia bacterium]|nr:MFS transporter [Acidimicrobiia bacterium]
MYGPVRLIYALRPAAPLPLVAGAVAVGLMFAATPFLIPEVTQRFGVSAGAAGYISVVQVGSFGVVAFLVPRLLSQSKRMLTGAAIILTVANLMSVLTTTFWLLLAGRGLAGAAAGVITWMVWSDAMSHPRSMVTISAVGPLTAMIGSPVIGAAAAGGDRAIFAVLCVVSALTLWLRPSNVVITHRRSLVSRSRSNRLLLGALALLTASGASLFVYLNFFAAEVLGLNPLSASFAFSLNAAGGLLGTQLASRHSRPGLFLISSGIAAVASVVLANPVAFYLSMGWWGFAFWMGLPGVLQMLSARSLEPSERAGDAQALMALGRAVGPAIGSGFAGSGRFVALAYLAGGGLVISGATVVSVQEGRERLPPTPLTA